MTDINVYRTNIEAVVEPVIRENGYELVDVEVAGSNYLRIRVEKPGGTIMLDECADLSRKIEAALDMTDVIPDKYFLEVSSPGIDRPLKKKEDFMRFAGKRISIITREKINNTHSFTGMLKGMEGDNVLLETEGAVTAIAFDIIKKAKLDEEISMKHSGNDAGEENADTTTDKEDVGHE